MSPKKNHYFKTKQAKKNTVYMYLKLEVQVKKERRADLKVSE